MLFPSLYVTLGFLCWWLAIRRIDATMRCRRLDVAAYVFLEEALTLITVYIVIKMDSPSAVFLYAIGSALGAFFATRSGKER